MYAMPRPTKCSSRGPPSGSDGTTEPAKSVVQLQWYTEKGREGK
jgi:hypothetical protein